MTTFFVSNSGSDTNTGTSVDAPWQTIARAQTALTPGDIRRGDALRFRRGDTFFGNLVPWAGAVGPGVRQVIGAYGPGPRPVLSAYKVCNLSGGWTLHAAGIWKIDLTAASGTHTGNTVNASPDIGHLLVDDVIYGAKKWTLGELAAAWDFTTDATHLYVKAAANPTTLAGDIRAAPDGIVLLGQNALLVSGLELVGSGGNGYAQYDEVKDVEVVGCKIHRCGGSQTSGTTRYGNGVQVWIGAVDFLAHYNEITDIYDTATTIQGPQTATALASTNVHFRHNRISNCGQSFEVWATGTNTGAGTGFVDCSFTDNVCLSAGQSWGTPVRPEPDRGAHLLAYSMQLPVDITVARNVFVGAASNYLWSSYPPAEGWVRDENTVLLKAGTLIQTGKAQTIADHAAWSAAEGTEQHSRFGVIPAAVVTADDLAAYVATHASGVAAGVGALALGLDQAVSDLTARVEQASYGRLIGSAHCPLRPGRYYVPAGLTTAGLLLTNGNMRGGMLPPPGRDATLGIIGCNVEVAGSAGAVVRMGVYRDNSPTRGDGSLTLVLDAGTVTATTTGDKTITISLPVLKDDILWLVAVGQGTPTTQPTLSAFTGSNPMLSGSSVSGLAGSNWVGVTGAAAGALPATLAPGLTATAVRVGVRA